MKRAFCLLVCLLLFSLPVQGYGGQLTTKLELNLDSPHELSHSTWGLITMANQGAHLGLFFRQGDDLDWRLDEAYVDFRQGALDLRIGKQRMAWGTALQINPTDVLNPIDIEDPMGDKLPIWALLGDYYLPGDWKITGVYIPYLQPAQEVLPTTPPTIVPLPDKTFANGEYAFKITRFGLGSFDFSLSYFNGWERFPHPAGFRPLEAFGVDLAGALGDLGLWVEAQLARATPGEDFLHFIVGGDYRLDNGLYLAAQYYYRDGEDYLLGALEKDLGLHKFKLGALYNLDQGASALMPSVVFSLADATNFTVGIRYVHTDNLGLPGLGKAGKWGYGELEYRF
jgi:hypothetical protein